MLKLWVYAVFFRAILLRDAQNARREARVRGNDALAAEGWGSTPAARSGKTRRRPADHGARRAPADYRSGKGFAATECAPCRQPGSNKPLPKCLFPVHSSR